MNKRELTHVLVVDCDRSYFLKVSELLSTVPEQTFILEWAPTYEVGYLVLSKRTHEICLLGCRSASESLDFIRQARSEGCSIPVVLLTDVEERDFEINTLQVGVSDYLIKNQLSPYFLEKTIRYAIYRAQTEDRARNLLDSAFEGIVVHDTQGMVLEINRVGAQMFDRFPAEMIGTDIRQYFTDSSISYMEAVITPFEVMNYEATGVKKDGTQVELELSEKAHQHQGLPARLISIRDMTIRKQTEAKILMQDRLASMGLLASSLAHEIGTPLGVIRGRAEFLANQTKNTPSITKNVDIIVSQIDRVTNLIRSLLNLARGDQIKQSGNANLGQIVQEVLDLIGHELRKHEITVYNLLGTDLLVRVRAEAKPLHQVLLNLLLNSVHAIESAIQSGKKEPNFIRIKSDDANDHYILSLQDSGCGISKANLRNLFKPFFTTKEIGFGTGLGLATSYRIVESWGGHIEVQSQEGVGSLFMIYIPKRGDNS